MPVFAFEDTFCAICPGINWRSYCDEHLTTDEPELIAMLSGIMHANTKAMLQAWQRMTSSGQSENTGPSADDYPGLLGRLFVVEQVLPDIVTFRIAGETLPILLGRNLVGSNFLDLWTGADRQLVTALLASILEDSRPGVIRLSGETHHGRRLDVEISIAPLEQRMNGGKRFLCLYQTLGGEAMLKSQPINTHKVKSIYPPEASSNPARTKPFLRLVPQP